VVTIVVDDHSHPIGKYILPILIMFPYAIIKFVSGPDYFKLYPDNRLLSKEEEKEVWEYLKLKVSNKMLKQHVEQKYGKEMKLQDFRNIKQRMRKDVSTIISH
jgi:hypothetical protein